LSAVVITYITRGMYDIVGQAWSSAHAEHGAVACTGLIRMWLNLSPQNK